MSMLLMAMLKAAAWTVGVMGLLLAAGWLSERWAERRQLRRYPPPGRLVDVGGRRLHLLEKGDAPGPTVVIEQGAGGPAVFWWPVQDAVARFARVCVYDRAGMGWSDPVRRSRSMSERVAELHRLLHAAGVPGPYVLVGHSYGGPLISLFARDYPDETAGLVFADTPDMESLLGPSYQTTTRKFHLPFARTMAFASRFGILRLVTLVAPRLNMAPGELPPAVRRAARASRRAVAWDAAVDDLVSFRAVPSADRRPLAPGALGDKPVGVISHTVPFPGPFAPLEEDFEPSQARLMALSSNSLQVRPPGAGHSVELDVPEATAETIRRVYEAARDGMQMTPRAVPLTNVA